jgi:hypothetical protein
MSLASSATASREAGTPRSGMGNDSTGRRCCCLALQDQLRLLFGLEKRDNHVDARLTPGGCLVPQPIAPAWPRQNAKPSSPWPGNPKHLHLHGSLPSGETRCRASVRPMARFQPRRFGSHPPPSAAIRFGSPRVHYNVGIRARHSRPQRRCMRRSEKRMTRPRRQPTTALIHGVSRRWLSLKSFLNHLVESGRKTQTVRLLIRQVH